MGPLVVDTVRNWRVLHVEAADAVLLSTGVAVATAAPKIRAALLAERRSMVVAR